MKSKVILFRSLVVCFIIFKSLPGPIVWEEMKAGNCCWRTYNHIISYYCASMNFKAKLHTSSYFGLRRVQWIRSSQHFTENESSFAQINLSLNVGPFLIFTFIFTTLLLFIYWKTKIINCIITSLVWSMFLSFSFTNFFNILLPGS